MSNSSTLISTDPQAMAQIIGQHEQQIKALFGISESQGKRVSAIELQIIEIRMDTPHARLSSAVAARNSAVAAVFTGITALVGATIAVLLRMASL